MCDCACGCSVVTALGRCTYCTADCPPGTKGEEVMEAQRMAPDPHYAMLIRELRRKAAELAEAGEEGDRIAEIRIVQDTRTSAWALVRFTGGGCPLCLLHGVTTTPPEARAYDNDAGVSVSMVTWHRKLLPIMAAMAAMDELELAHCEQCGHELQERWARRRGEDGSLSRELPVHVCPGCGWTDRGACWEFVEEDADQ